MEIRKNTLWRVPVFCAAAGIVSFYLMIWWLGRFAIEKVVEGDQTIVSVNNNKSLLLYGILFIAAVLIGKFFAFRDMTRKEIFWSATILVVFLQTVFLIQLMLGGVTGTLGVIMLYLSEISEWSRLISQLIFRFTDNLWIGGFIENFAPYVFVLFGKRGAAYGENNL